MYNNQPKPPIIPDGIKETLGALKYTANPIVAKKAKVKFKCTNVCSSGSYHL